MLEKDLVYKVVGCSLEVLNTIGHGLREKTYENALCAEFKIRGIDYTQQAVFSVYYKNIKIDEFIPDLVVENKVIVELKTVDSIIDEHRGQILNYLKATGLQVGLILNFKHPKLEWERLVLTANKRE